MKLNELQYRIAQQQSEAKANAQARASENAQLVQNQITKNVVVPVIPTGYIPIKRSLISDDFTWQTLTGTGTTVSRRKLADFTVPTGELYLFAPPDENDFNAGFFYGRIYSDSTGSVNVNNVAISVEVTDSTERHVYGVVVEIMSRMLNSQNPADIDERTYFVNTKNVEAHDGDKIILYVNGTATATTSVNTTGSFFGFEFYELIRAG